MAYQNIDFIATIIGQPESVLMLFLNWLTLLEVLVVPHFRPLVWVMAFVLSDEALVNANILDQLNPTRDAQKLFVRKYLWR